MQGCARHPAGPVAILWAGPRHEETLEPEIRHRPRPGGPRRDRPAGRPVPTVVRRPERLGRVRADRREDKCSHRRSEVQQTVRATMTTQLLHETAIENWMLTISQDGGVDRYDDLHVDQIDARWTSRDLWISAGLEAFHLALKLRDRHRLRLTVALAFSLESRAHPEGADFRTLAGLKDLLDWSPPSIYLFHSGQEPWHQKARSGPSHAQSEGSMAQTINVSEVLGTAIQHTVYLLDFRQPDGDEYYRTCFIAG